MMDIYSDKGRFGWMKIGEGNELPYIVRFIDGVQVTLTSVKIVEKALLKKYLDSLDARILKCTSVQGFLMTKVEAKLFNNLKYHTEQEYGEEPFVPEKDYLVRIEDLKEFYAFVMLCYNKLKGITMLDVRERCGFVQLNSVQIPYCCIEDDRKYLPLFFFEGETENLQKQVVRIDKWNLAYFKFCCVVQNIRKEEYDQDWCLVISLEDVMSYFPPDLTIKEFWPNDIAVKKLLIKPNDLSTNAPCSWVHILKSTPLIPRSTAVTHTFIPASPPKSLPLPPVVPAPPVNLVPPNNVQGLFENGFTSNQTENSETSVEPIIIISSDDDDDDKTSTTTNLEVSSSEITGKSPLNKENSETSVEPIIIISSDDDDDDKTSTTTNLEVSSSEITGKSPLNKENSETSVEPIIIISSDDDDDDKTSTTTNLEVSSSEITGKSPLNKENSETSVEPIIIISSDDDDKTSTTTNLEVSSSEITGKSPLNKENSETSVEPLIIISSDDDDDDKTSTTTNLEVSSSEITGKSPLNKENSETSVEPIIIISSDDDDDNTITTLNLEKSNSEITGKLPLNKRKCVEKITLPSEEEPVVKKRLSIKKKKRTTKTAKNLEKKVPSLTISNVTKVPDKSNEFSIATLNDKDESIVAKIPSDKTTAMGSNLLGSNLSVLRSTTINVASSGKANNPTNAIVTEPCNIAPRIDRTNLKNIITKVGTMISFNIKVTGEPVPNTKWMINYKDIQVGKRMKLTYFDYSTELSICLAKRKDSGHYILTAENINGIDVAFAEVTVLDKPSAPERPLKFSDVYAERCQLSWKEPKDDGGQQIKNYVIEKLDKALGCWAHVDKTDGPVTNLYIKNLVPGLKYKFRVMAVNEVGMSDPLIAKHCIKVEYPFDTPSRPLIPEIKAYGNVFVELGWVEPETDGGSPIMSYIIEMKDNSFGSTWVKAAETSRNSGIVSGLIKGNQYEFRVCAVNKAGPSVASQPTLPHVARQKELDSHNDHNMLVQTENMLNFNTIKSKEISATKECSLGGNILMTIESSNNSKNEDKLKKLDVKSCDDGLYNFTEKNINGVNKTTVIDEPSKPKTPIIIDYDNQSVTLKWEASERNGSSIEKYIIEKKDRLIQEWELALEVSTIEFKAKVPKLKEKSELQFRIIAVNQAGPSPASDPTNIHIVKHKSLKPIIDRTNLKNIVVSGGNTVKYDVNIKGEPAPIVKWQLVDKEVKSEGNVQIVNIPCNTIITLHDTQRKDSGLYKIIAENKFGKDEATVKVTVLNPPTRPQGPLKIKSVTSNGVVIKWRKPKDDGGKPVTAYIVEKTEAQTEHWKLVGFTQGPEMNIKGLQEGQKYYFRVKALNKEGESKALKSNESITTKNLYKIPGKPDTPKITDSTSAKPDHETGAPVMKFVIPKKKHSNVCDEILTTKIEPVHLRKLFVGSLNYKTTDDDLKKYFEQWGKIMDFVVVKDPQTKQSRCFGFITFAAAHMVDNVQGARPHMIDGCTIKLKRVVSKTDIGNPEIDTTVKKLFVRWNCDNITEEDLREYFSVYGNVTSASIILDKDTSEKRRFGYVKFDDYDPVDKICLIGSHKIKDKRIYVKKALSVEEMARINTTNNRTWEPEADIKVKKLLIRFPFDSITEEDIIELFSAYGNVTSVFITLDKNKVENQGFGFVEFDDYAPVDEICLKKSYTVKGQYICVEKSNERKRVSGNNRSILELFRSNFKMDRRHCGWRDGNNPDQWKSGPSFEESNWRGPSTSSWDDNFGNSYQQNVDFGPMRRSRSLVRGAVAGRPYLSRFNSGNNIGERGEDALG